MKKYSFGIGKGTLEIDEEVAKVLKLKDLVEILRKLNEEEKEDE